MREVEKEMKNLVSRKNVLKEASVLLVAAILVLASLVIVPIAAVAQARVDGLAPKATMMMQSQPHAPLGGRGYFYGYCANDPTGGHPVGPITFDTPDAIQSLGSGPSWIAGADIDTDGNWYGVLYYGGIYLIGFDGTMTFIANCTPMNGLCFDSTTSTWYGIDDTYLYIVYITSGETEVIGALGTSNTLVGIACDLDGNLYAYDVLFSGSSKLYSIDKSTGTATVIGPMGVGFVYAQDPAYDRDNSILYIAGYTQSSTSGLYTCNVDTGAVTLVDYFEGYMEVDGFAIPWGQPEYVPGEAIVGFLGPLPYFYQDIVYKIESKYGITLKDMNDDLCAVLYTDVDNEDLIQMLEDPDIKYVGRNYNEKLCMPPNDPFFGLQWGPPHIGAPAAWDYTTGSPTLKVAVVDSGIDYNHPDIVGNYQIGGYDFVNGDNDPFDDNGHGTHCAGVIGAVGNNSFGITGMAWNIKIIAEKVFDSAGIGNSWLFAQGFEDAVKKGAKIISYSGGGPDTTLKRNAVRSAYNNGCLLVAASGNDGGPVLYPAAYPEVIAVGATDQSDNLAWFSNYGAQQELVAPGVNIISLGLSNRYSMNEGVYRDNDGDNKVSTGDIRLFSGIPGYAHGSTVATGNGDIGMTLKNFGLLEKFADYGDTSGTFDSNDWIYNDTNDDNIVNTDDLRLFYFHSGSTYLYYGTLVQPSDYDFNLPLYGFPANEKRTIYSYLSGTSMACPHVSGVAALIWALNGNLTRDEVRCILRSTAQNLGTPNLYGYGLVRADDSVSTASFRFKISVSPTYQTISASSYIPFTINVQLLQGPATTITIDRDTFYPLNGDLTIHGLPISGLPGSSTFPATFYIEANSAPAFYTNVLRLDASYTLGSCPCVRKSNFFTVANLVNPEDFAWIATFLGDTGATPRNTANRLWTSPWIESTPNPPILGAINQLKVTVGNKGSDPIGPVKVKAWYNDYPSYVPVIDFQEVGPEQIIPTIGAHSTNFVTFNWDLPATYSHHVCMIAQAWRDGIESFDPAFDIVHNNNIAAHNFAPVFAHSPYTTTFTLKNPTDGTYNITFRMKPPNTDWAIDLCNPSIIENGEVVTQIMIPPGEQRNLTLTILMPTNETSGSVEVKYSIEGYEELYKDMLGGFTFEVIRDERPSAPTIDGPTNGKINVEHEYTFSSVDPDQDDVYYYVDWGDNSNSWIGPYGSGATASATHKWSEKGTYTIRAKARDIYGAESDWGYLEVTMPKNKAYNYNSFSLSRLFERFPNIFPIIRKILGL